MRRAIFLACTCAILLVLTGGCARTLTGTSIFVRINEAGLAANSDFPGAIVELSRDGSCIRTVQLQRGENTCSFSCSPGIYTVTARSEDRIASSEVETSTGSKTLILNYDTISIYGEIVLDSVRLSRSFGSVHLDLLQHDQVINAIDLSGEFSYRFLVSPGSFKLRAIYGDQTVVFSFDATQSQLRNIDLARTCQITGIVLEKGELPGPDWPGGFIQVENLEGHIVDEAKIDAERSKFNFAVKPGLYLIKAQSCGRKLTSDIIDLSVENAGGFRIDFEEAVLFGELRNPDRNPPVEIVALKNNVPVFHLSLDSGSTKYALVLPSGNYDIELRVPQYGGLGRYSVSLDRSKRLDLDPLRKVFISGQITENGLVPNPADFPEAGHIRIRSQDGVLRETAEISTDGSFQAEVFAGEYTIEAFSEGRVVSAFRDASRSNQSVTINYDDIVLQGTLAWRDGGVIPSFPETEVQLCTSGLEVKKIILPRGTSTFSTVVPAGEYSVRMVICGTNITVVKNLGGPLKRSTRSTLDISSDVFHLTGRITANGNVPTGPTSVGLTDQFGALQIVDTNSVGEYELFVRKGSTNIQLSCPSYLPATYSVYVGGDTRRDLAFTHCNIACALTLKSSLLSTDCLVSAALNDYLGRNTPLTDVLFAGATYLLPFVQRVYTFNIVAPIGEKVHFQVIGIDVGAMIRWTVIAEQNCSEVRTIPVVLGG